MLAPKTTEANEARPAVPQLLALPKRDGRMKALGVNEEQQLERAEKVHQLRLEGKSFKQIAAELNIPLSTAYRDRKMIARMKYAGLIEKDETLIMDQNNKLDELLARWFELATKEFSVGEQKTNKRGEDYDIVLSEFEAAGLATDKVMKILEHQAKLNGLIAQGGLAAGPRSIPADEVGTAIAAGVFAAYEKFEKDKQQKRETAIDAEFENEAGRGQARLE
jgi:hypothetical protein